MVKPILLKQRDRSPRPQMWDSESGKHPSRDAGITRPRLSDARAKPFAAGLASSPSVHLDALRGFAAFSVLLNHWRDAFFADYTDLPNRNPVGALFYLVSGLGHQWVIVFFVMSGYLVGGSVLRSIGAGRWSWRSYLLARLTRLYVVLLPALVLGAAIDQAGMHIPGTETVYSGQSGMHSVTVDVHATSRFRTLVENSLFLQTIALPGMHGGQRVPCFGSNGPLWSLCNEFWYYMAFPLLVILFINGRSSQTRVGCGLALLLLGWFVGPRIMLLGIPWLMGTLITFLPAVRPKRSWIRGLMIVVAIGLVGAGLVVDKSLGSLGSDLILGVAVTVLIWVTLHCATAPLPEIYSRIAGRAARSSYTLYLVHLPLLVFLKAAFHIPRSVPSIRVVFVSVAILLVVLLFAQLVYQIFERNTDRIRAWIKPFILKQQVA